MVSEPLPLPLNQTHPILGEIKWHPVHSVWYGQFPGSQGTIGLKIPESILQDPDKIGQAMQYIQKIAESEGEIKLNTADSLRSSGELMENEVGQFLAETRVMHIEFAWGEDQEVGVWFPGGELLDQYNVLAIVDQFMKVKNVVIP